MMKTGEHLLALSFYVVQDPRPGNGAGHFQDGSFTSIRLYKIISKMQEDNKIKIIPRGCVWSFVSQVSPDLIKLAVNTIHPTW